MAFVGETSVEVESSQGHLDLEISILRKKVAERERASEIGPLGSADADVDFEFTPSDLTSAQSMFSCPS